MCNDKLIKKLKSERHDFMNHLQTLYGMAQLERNEQILKYIKSLNNDLINLNSSKEITYNSILDPILMIKKKEAKKKEIELYYHLDKGIKNLDIQLNKISRILFNLIDNAIEAIKDVNGQKEIRILGENRTDDYVLSIYNKSVIDQKLIDKLFKPGFSTKGEKRGYGLYIVNSLVEKIGGELKIKSEEEFGTQVICYLPK